MQRQYTADRSQPIGQYQHSSAELLSSISRDWWKTTHHDISFPADPSFASLIRNTDLSAVQGFQSTPFDTAFFILRSIEGTTRSGCQASAHGPKTKYLIRKPSIASIIVFLFGIGLWRQRVYCLPQPIDPAALDFPDRVF